VRVLSLLIPPIPPDVHSTVVIASAGGMAGELDGSRQRYSDHEGITPSASEHRQRTTIRRREVGAGNGKRSRIGADRSSGRPPTESERIGDRCDKLITRILTRGQIERQTNRVRVSLPLFSSPRPRRRIAPASRTVYDLLKRLPSLKKIPLAPCRACWHEG
jgi:hypothetical protein